MKAQRRGFIWRGGVTKRHEVFAGSEAWRRKRNERSYSDDMGGLAQLGERLPCKQGGQRFDPANLHQVPKKK